jgi:hypothetical protein
MMMRTVFMIAMAAVGPSLRMERGLDPYKIRSESMEHILDHMVGSNAERSFSNFSWQMSISQMPSKAYKLIGILVADFHNQLGSSLNLQPPAIFELQAISVGHRNRLRQVQKDIFALICSQANAPAMACLKVKSEDSRRFFLRPTPGAAMD